MSLARASRPDGTPIHLVGSPPFPAAALRPLRGVRFHLPADDPALEAPTGALATWAEGTAAAWARYPDWMDYLAPGAPGGAVKRLEQELYLHRWAPWLDARRVLDVGAGIGRFATALLDRGADVWAVDADLESLRRCAWHAAGRPGRLELSWSTAARLPDVEVELALASELLCYVDEPAEVLDAILARLRPGGALLCSVEARWGWAASPDAPAGSIEAALAGGVLDVPGDRWVRTFDADGLRALLEGAGLEVVLLLPTHYATSGPLERCLPEGIGLPALLELEARCRAHPTWGPLHRALTAAAIKPRARGAGPR